MESEEIIFNLTREDWDYKGVLFAEMDTSLPEEMGMGKMPPGYVVGVMGLIWTDEKGVWHGKMRLKFPSGNKLVVAVDFDEEIRNGVVIDVDYAVNRLYKMPMVNKLWTPNPDGAAEGIIDIVKRLDMIESIRYEEK